MQIIKKDGKANRITNNCENCKRKDVETTLLVSYDNSKPSIFCNGCLFVNMPSSQRQYETIIKSGHSKCA